VLDLTVVEIVWMLKSLVHGWEADLDVGRTRSQKEQKVPLSSRVPILDIEA
jgi:hypothetical protein